MFSPLNSVPKKNTNKRRIIMDLSFPPDNCVNNTVSKTHYLGELVNLSYPKIDDFVSLIKRIFNLQT